MNLRNVFGVDVHQAFLDWFYGEYAVEFHAKYGRDAGMTLVILDSDRVVEALIGWDRPQDFEMFHVYLGDKEASEKPEGTYQNVLGKLRFCLRVGDDSLKAETNPLWLRSGDFPWQGAGHHNDQIGGVSGLKKEEDWAEFCRCAEKLNELIALVNTKVMEIVAAAWEDKPSMPAGMRYFRGIDVSAHFSDMPKAA